LLREPFATIRQLSIRTSELTVRLDPVIAPMIVNSGMLFALAKRVVSRTSQQQRFAAGGLVAVFAFMVAVMALVLFPITIISSIVAGISLACVSPLLLALAWIVLSANPIREQLCQPCFDKLLTYPLGKTVFLQN
jgi:hypothetical protein